MNLGFQLLSRQKEACTVRKVPVAIGARVIFVSDGASGFEGRVTDMANRWRDDRWRGGRRWLMRAGCMALGVGALSGCSEASGWWQQWQAGAWYGYYYENVMVSAAPAMSKPFASARQCLAAMRAYTHTSASWTGFACARGCTSHKDGTVTDCAEVVH